MEVILLERIEKVGKLGDVVKVKAGFARNYLLPQNKALRANKKNLSIYEKEKEKYEKLNNEKLSAAEKIAKKMESISINIIKQASDSGQLYGSVSTRDIAEELNNQGHNIEKRQIVLKSVIKNVGQHEVRVVIHPEFIINISVNIARTLEELTIQSEEIENFIENKENNKEDNKEEIISIEASEEGHKKVKTEEENIEENQEKL
ncbi:MAG TPA: 50S ribosomal protein L9 [Alphaproteobacteria bacterium]|nr:50S ribosomal protein L9 [Alphaproteobacteria bacterium]